MIEVLIYILIGTFIGWNLPQPVWARTIQEKLTNFVKEPKK
jgi:hypothetical protein